MSLRETLSRRTSLITLIVIVIACLVSLGIDTNSFRVKPKEVGLSVVGLFQQGFSAIGSFLSGTVTSIRELRDLNREYDALREQLREYENVAGDIALLQSENERLRRALEFSEQLVIENIPARVIAKEPGSFFTGLTINRGTAAGVRRDMPVIANQGGVRALVGRVSETGLTTSVVMPVFDTRSYVAARLERSRHEGLVRGIGQASSLLRMDYVSENARAQVSAGDMVITSGMRSIFPEGIQIGTVESIRGEAYESSLQIDLEPEVDFSRLEYVFVLGVSQ